MKRKETIVIPREERIPLGLREKEITERAEALFRPIPERYFETRQIEIIADETMSVMIPGKEDSLSGYHLTSQNISNPNPLEIAIEEGQLLQDPQSPKTLYLKEGTISISGEKRFEPLERLERKKELELLPVRDPDLTKIDGREFRQTGTLQIKVKGAIIKLEE